MIVYQYMDIAQLTELPKAEKVFREYVGGHIDHLISQSESLADKYIQERETIQSKHRSSQEARRELQRTVALL